MPLYNCLCVIGGGQLEVPKFGISQYEIQLLRAIHGSDGVKAFRLVGEVERTPEEELQSIGQQYGVEPVEKAFGVSLAMFAPIVEDEPEVQLPDAITLGAALEIPVKELSAPVAKRVSGTTAPGTVKMAKEMTGLAMADLD